MPLAEERKVISVLFVDLVGSTAAADGADPEDVRRVLAPYHARVKNEIERFGGTVEKFVGDAVMAVFGAPAAHEDDAERAVRAALRAVEVCDDLGVQARSAVSTGEALVALGAHARDGEAFVAGDVVNTSARLQSSAPNGCVVVDERTFRSTRDMIDYEELTPVELKGKRGPVRLWQATGTRNRAGVDVEHRARAPFVGRRTEIDLLRDSLERSVREHTVQLMTIAGEPGVGKTRLVFEFRQWAEAHHADLAWRQGRCLPYGDGITYWALGEVVKAQAGIAENDPPELAVAKLSESVANTVDEAERPWVEAKLAALVGLGPGGGGDRADAFAAWTCFLEGVGACSPLVMVVEDLHWSDPPLVEFLEHVLDFAGPARILLICTARPELYERHPGWGGGKRNSSTVALPPLTDVETTELVTGLLARAALRPGLQEGLRERSGGNPLYAEELVRVMVERGQEAADMVPHGVHAVIAARIDLLAPDAKAVLQEAAVVGKVFWPGAVAAVGGRDVGQVERLVRELVRKEFVRPAARRSSVGGENEYSFWHATVRDVAYGQIPRGERAMRHRAAAVWIEGVAPGRQVDHAELIAHHYAEALRLARASGLEQLAAEVLGPACRYLELAGDRALPLDPRQSDVLYKHALALMEAGNPGRASVLVKRMKVFGWVQDVSWADAEGVFAEATAIYTGRADNFGIGAVNAFYAPVVYYAGDWARAAELVKDAVRRLEQEPSGPELAQACASAALLCEEDDVLALARRASELAGDDDGLRAEALVRLGMARAAAGDQGGRDDLLAALEVAKGAGLSRETVSCLNDLSVLDAGTTGPVSSLAWAEQAIALSGRRGLGGAHNWNKSTSLNSRFELGHWDDVVRVADEVRAWEQQNMRYLAGIYALYYPICVLVWRGRPDLASSYEQELLERSRETGRKQCLAAVALLAAARGELDDALALLCEVAEAKTDLRISHVHEEVRLAIACGDLELAQRLRENEKATYPRTEHVLVTADAAIAEVRGDTELALRLYRDAANRWEAWGFVLEEALALLGVDRCGADAEARARGDRLLATLSATVGRR
ncbi:MAG TPA: AAA family ATPase [Acidimicrobiales bacterium]|nr:AAA family ATPase [Acidimicrobiales bacterium]